MPIHSFITCPPPLSLSLPLCGSCNSQSGGPLHSRSQKLATVSNWKYDRLHSVCSTHFSKCMAGVWRAKSSVPLRFPRVCVHTRENWWHSEEGKWQRLSSDMAITAPLTLRSFSSYAPQPLTSSELLLFYASVHFPLIAVSFSLFQACLQRHKEMAQSNPSCLAFIIPQLHNVLHCVKDQLQMKHSKQR